MTKADIYKALSQLKNNKGEKLKVRIKDKTYTIYELFKTMEKGFLK